MTANEPMPLSYLKSRLRDEPACKGCDWNEGTVGWTKEDKLIDCSAYGEDRPRTEACHWFTIDRQDGEDFSTYRRRRRMRWVTYVGLFLSALGALGGLALF